MASCSDYITPQYTRSEVNEAGRYLSTQIPETDRDRAIEAFRIAYNWRDAHFEPLKYVRRELAGKIRSTKVEAVTAARPKRMISIRRKLSDKRHHSLKLTQIQDLVGCRAILNDNVSLNRLLDKYLSGESIHEVKHTDYIKKPRESGYRGHHLILKFNDNRLPDCFANFKIEVQLRTRLQHAWATAVEAVGLLRDEDLKSGVGSDAWLKLFALMGSEMAEIEKSPLVVGTPESVQARRSELIEIEENIGAVNFLRDANESFRLAEEYLSKPSREYYILRYSRQANQVWVGGFSSFQKGLSDEHESGNAEGQYTTVLVQVDQVENLRVAYPNYFMDVSFFIELLAESVGKIANLKKPSRPTLSDLSWFSEYNSKRLRNSD